MSIVKKRFHIKGEFLKSHWKEASDCKKEQDEAALKIILRGADPARHNMKELKKNSTKRYFPTLLIINGERFEIELPEDAQGYSNNDEERTELIQRKEIKDQFRVFLHRVLPEVKKELLNYFIYSIAQVDLMFTIQGILEAEEKDKNNENVGYRFPQFNDETLLAFEISVQDGGKCIRTKCTPQLAGELQRYEEVKIEDPKKINMDFEIIADYFYKKRILSGKEQVGRKIISFTAHRLDPILFPNIAKKAPLDPDLIDLTLVFQGLLTGAICLYDLQSSETLQHQHAVLINILSDDVLKAMEAIRNHQRKGSFNFKFNDDKSKEITQDNAKRFQELVSTLGNVFATYIQHLVYKATGHFYSFGPNKEKTTIEVSSDTKEGAIVKFRIPIKYGKKEVGDFELTLHADASNQLTIEEATFFMRSDLLPKLLTANHQQVEALKEGPSDSNKKLKKACNSVVLQMQADALFPVTMVKSLADNVAKRVITETGPTEQNKKLIRLVANLSERGEITDNDLETNPDEKGKEKAIEEPINTSLLADREGDILFLLAMNSALQARKILSDNVLVNKLTAIQLKALDVHYKEQEDFWADYSGEQVFLVNLFKKNRILSKEKANFEIEQANGRVMLLDEYVDDSLITKLSTFISQTHTRTKENSDTGRQIIILTELKMLRDDLSSLLEPIISLDVINQKRHLYQLSPTTYKRCEEFYRKLLPNAVVKSVLNDLISVEDALNLPNLSPRLAYHIMINIVKKGSEPQKIALVKCIINDRQKNAKNIQTASRANGNTILRELLTDAAIVKQKGTLRDENKSVVILLSQNPHLLSYALNTGFFLKYYRRLRSRDLSTQMNLNDKDKIQILIKILNTESGIPAAVLSTSNSKGMKITNIFRKPLLKNPDYLLELFVKANWIKLNSIFAYDPELKFALINKFSFLTNKQKEEVLIERYVELNELLDEFNREKAPNLQKTLNEVINPKNEILYQEVLTYIEKRNHIPLTPVAVELLIKMTENPKTRQQLQLTQRELLDIREKASAKSSTQESSHHDMSEEKEMSASEGITKKRLEFDRDWFFKSSIPKTEDYQDSFVSAETSNVNAGSTITTFSCKTKGK